MMTMSSCAKLKSFAKLLCLAFACLSSLTDSKDLFQINQTAFFDENSNKKSNRNLRKQRKNNALSVEGNTNKVHAIGEHHRVLATSNDKRSFGRSLYYSIFPFDVFPDVTHITELTEKTKDWIYGTLQPHYGDLVSVDITIHDVHSNHRAAYQVEVDMTMEMIFDSSGSAPTVGQILQYLNKGALESYVSNYLWSLDIDNPCRNTFAVSQQPLLTGQQNVAQGTTDSSVWWATGGEVAFGGDFGFGFSPSYDPAATPESDDLNDLKGWLNEYVGRKIEAQYGSIFRSLSTSIDDSSVSYNGGSMDTVTMKIGFVANFDENAPVIPSVNDLYRLMKSQDLRDFISIYLWAEYHADDYWYQVTQMSWNF